MFIGFYLATLAESTIIKLSIYMVRILGVEINSITKAQAVEKVISFFKDDRPHTVITSNPEMLVKARHDEYFRAIINNADLNICDGFGLWLAMKAQNLKRQAPSINLERITGVDFMIDLCRLAALKNKSVYLLGSGSDEVVAKTAAELQRQLPGIKVVGWNKGPVVEEKKLKLKNNATNRQSLISNPQSFLLSSHSGLTIDQSENQKIIDEINTIRPDIIFVAFGMGKQEKWIHEHIGQLPSVAVAMGVGGSFDFISGRVKRAPCWMRKIGLEWLYRWLRQPWRAGRILNATVKFMFYLVLK